jgi:AP-2 complex subunit beta-1
MSSTNDAKLFQRSKVQELRSDLLSEKKDKNYTRKKTTLKKIIANATMGNDMSALFNEVVDCLGIQVLEIKKMVCEYVAAKRMLEERSR